MTARHADLTLNARSVEVGSPNSPEVRFWEVRCARESQWVFDYIRHSENIAYHRSGSSLGGRPLWLRSQRLRGILAISCTDVSGRSHRQGSTLFCQEEDRRHIAVLIGPQPTACFLARPSGARPPVFRVFKKR